MHIYIVIGKISREGFFGRKIGDNKKGIWGWAPHEEMVDGKWVCTGGHVAIPDIGF